MTQRTATDEYRELILSGVPILDRFSAKSEAAPSVDGRDDPWESTLLSREPDPLEVVAKRDECRRLVRALGEDAEIVVRWCCGERMREIGDSAGRCESAVYYRVRNALGRARETLEVA